MPRKVLHPQPERHAAAHATYRSQRTRVSSPQSQNAPQVNLEVEHQEFVEWRWESLDAMPSLVVDFKRPVYEAVVAEFGPLLAARSKSSGASGAQNGASSGGGDAAGDAAGRRL